jgi:hypothetical protein
MAAMTILTLQGLSAWFLISFENEHETSCQRLLFVTLIGSGCRLCSVDGNIQHSHPTTDASANYFNPFLGVDFAGAAK